MGPIRTTSSGARRDFGLREFRTVGEFDGAQKYGRLLKPGQPPGDAIDQEKVREDRIRELGWHVVRWTWSDLEHPQGLGDRIRRALELRPGRSYSAPGFTTPHRRGVTNTAAE